MESIIVYGADRTTPAAIVKLPIAQINFLSDRGMIYKNRATDAESDWINSPGVNLLNIATEVFHGA
jgi:hypothetical protein